MKKEVEGMETKVDNEMILEFKKPYVFEDKTYTEIDLSGLYDLTAKDMEDAELRMAKKGDSNFLPEITMGYTLFIASRATGLPIEFFESLPTYEAIVVKGRVRSFLFK